MAQDVLPHLDLGTDRQELSQYRLSASAYANGLVKALLPSIYFYLGGIYIYILI